MLKSICIIVLATALTASCSSNKRSLETRDDISFHSDQSETQLFTYNMYWYVPLSARERRDVGLLSLLGLSNSTSVSVDNENKLRLEDMAVRKLNDKIKDSGNCRSGHEIVNTLWFERSIQLSGKCK